MMVPRTKTEQSMVGLGRVEGPTVSKGEFGIRTTVGHRDESIEDGHYLCKQNWLGTQKGTCCLESLRNGQD